MIAEAVLIACVNIHGSLPEEETRLAVGYREGVPAVIELLPIGTDQSGSRLYLNPEAAMAWRSLRASAADAGFELTVNYAFRSQIEQRKLYRQNWRLAAKPGHSNHQLGLSLDLNGMRHCSRKGCARTKQFFWMKKNAPKYGFALDISYELWHLTYTQGARPPEERSVADSIPSLVSWEVPCTTKTQVPYMALPG